MMKVGPDVSVTHRRASSQQDAQRWDTRVKGERRRRGPNLRSRTNARRVRRRKNTTLCTWTLARDFLSAVLDGRIASWHPAAQDDAPTAPKHSSVTLGIWVRICPLLTKYVLEVWMSLVLVEEPALWRVYLRLRRTALAPKAIMVSLVPNTLFVKSCIKYDFKSEQHHGSTLRQTSCRDIIIYLFHNKFISDAQRRLLWFHRSHCRQVRHVTVQLA